MGGLILMVPLVCFVRLPSSTVVSRVRDGRANRGWLWAGWFTFALLLGACGGGDDGVASFASDDGVVSVVVPQGAAADDFKGSVSLGDASALGVDVSDVDGVLLAYELGPDGTEFSEPVTVTFRISPAVGGFDPSLGLPLAVVVIEDGAGGFEPLGSMTSFFDGDVLVVEGTTTHFSTAIGHIWGLQIELVVHPPGRSKQVKSVFEVSITRHGSLVGAGGSQLVNRVDYSTQGPIEVVDSDRKTATMECTEEGVGTISAKVLSDIGAIEGLSMASLLFSGNFDFLTDLSLEIECVDEPAASSSTTSTTSTTLPPGQDPPGDQEGGTNGSVTGKEDGGDIVGVRYARGEAGEHCFFIDVVADGEKVATNTDQTVRTDWYEINIGVVDSGAEGGEWRANLIYLVGAHTDRGVKVGPTAPGQLALEGATVSAEWVDGDTVKITVAGGGTEDLSVESFTASIGVSKSNIGEFYDSATGLGES